MEARAHVVEGRHLPQPHTQHHRGARPPGGSHGPRRRRQAAQPVLPHQRRPRLRRGIPPSVPSIPHIHRQAPPAQDPSRTAPERPRRPREAHRARLAGGVLCVGSSRRCTRTTDTNIALAFARVRRQLEQRLEVRPRQDPAGDQGRRGPPEPEPEAARPRPRRGDRYLRGVQRRHEEAVEGSHREADPGTPALQDRRLIRLVRAPVFMSVRLPVTYASQSFLDDIDRIAVPDYEPTDEDIVRARLRTVGVQEHRFVIDESPSFAPLSDHGKEWIMYDVGGTRSSVRVPYIPSSAARLTCVCAARSMGVLFRRRGRHHISLPDIVLRRTATRRQERQPFGGQHPAVAQHLLVPHPRQDADHPLSQQVRHPAQEDEARRAGQGLRPQFRRSQKRHDDRHEVYVVLPWAMHTS